MPFKSLSQKAYLFIHHPEVAHEFAEHTTEEQEKRLPKRKKAKRKKGGKER